MTIMNDLSRANGLFRLFVIGLVFAACSSAAYAQSTPLVEGKYQCFTLSTMYAAPPSPDSPAEVTRRQTGNKVRPIVLPQLFLSPALFGNVILDGKGGYTMPSTRQSGRYGFNKAKGLPTFTGDLGAMQLVEYDGTGRSFVVGLQGMNFHCGLPADPSKPIAAGSQAPNSAFISRAGVTKQTAVASDFNGHFEGSYMCGGTETYMQLDLRAKADGSISGTMHFGGVKTPEINYSLGSYALKGRWQGAHYELKADYWIKQPQGYVMIDLEGDLTSKGTAGKVLYSSCDSFALFRT
jgi:hypothetical protein